MYVEFKHRFVCEIIEYIVMCHSMYVVWMLHVHLQRSTHYTRWDF